MRSSKFGLLVMVIVFVFALAGGCTKKKPSFTPEAAPAPAPSTTAPSPGATQPQNLGTEGFSEKPLAPGETGAEAEAAGAAAVAAALKTIYFAYDSDALSDQALATLTANASWLSQHPKVRVLIAGHCDERGTVEYNLALGERRAASVREHLVRLGVPADRLEIISYGKERPAEPGHEEGAWSKNRRAEFGLATP